ncbi:UDP-N-acetylglucosamine--LPS N-acetylglucosamine transferase, partial [Rothia sp. 27098_8_161]
QPDVESSLADEKTYWAYYPTTRNIKNAIRNLFLAFHIFPKEHPDAVVSAGAGVAVPFFVAAKLFGVKTLYIECFDRPTLPTMTGKILYTFADRMIVQSEEQQENFPDSRVIHPIF